MTMFTDGLIMTVILKHKIKSKVSTATKLSGKFPPVIK